MRFTIFQDSRPGDRRDNEDRVGYSYGKDVLLMVIADGMGGHLRGEVAAEIAVNEITRLFQREARQRLASPADFLAFVINAAHRAIVSHAVAANLLESPRTTCVACVVQDGKAWWVHAGDSRLYVLRAGRLVACTRDHSRVQQLIDAGSITEQMAAVHPERNKIYSCLGGGVPPVIAAGGEFALEKGDTIVLSTDGFWSRIPAPVIANRLGKDDVLALMPGLLTEAQRLAKGESDNLSVVAMTWEAQDDPRQPATATIDEEVERTIAEIRDAIRKVPR
jgi:PPM family protein phosphatase